MFLILRHFAMFAALGIVCVVVAGCGRKPAAMNGLWSARMDGFVSHSAAAGQGLVFVVSENGVLRAFSAAQGSNIWTVTGLGQPLSGPVAAGPAVCQATMDGYMYGFSAWTGARLWTISPFGPLTMKSEGRFVAFFNELDGHVYGMDAMDGALKWDFDPGSGVIVGPVINSNIVYLLENAPANGKKGRLLGLAGHTGELQMEIPLDDDASDLAVADGRIILAQANGLVWAIEVSGSRLLWRRQTGHSISTQIVPLGDEVYYGTTDGWLYCLNSATGEERWRFEAGQSSLSALALDGHQAFLAEWRRHWLAMDLRARAVLWKVSAPEAGATLPAMAENCVVWTLPDGSVRAFGKNSRNNSSKTP